MDDRCSGYKSQKTILVQMLGTPKILSLNKIILHLVLKVSYNMNNRDKKNVIMCKIFKKAHECQD